MTATHRVLLLLRRLMGRRGYTVQQLAVLVNRDPKTVRRDLAAIRAAGFRLRAVSEARGRKRWRVEVVVR